MKRIVETNYDGLAALLGEKVTIFCTRYIYYGKLAGVNDTFCLLEDPAIVYSTGAWDTPQWSDVQKLPTKEWHIMLQSIECFGIAKTP